MKEKIWEFLQTFMIFHSFKEQLLQMNMIPCGYHRYYYREEEMLAHGLEEYNDPKVGTRGQQVQQTEHELFELYKNPDLDHKPEQLAKRGGSTLFRCGL